MKNLVLAVACIGLLGSAVAPSARADEWTKRTVITVHETIQVPNKVLPPGTYVMKLMDSPSNRHIVQIFDQGEQHLETTILAIPNYRLEPTGKTVITFWETPPGQPKALRAWFYPGDNFGQEFAYPKTTAISLAQASKTPVPTTEATKPSEMATAPVGVVNEKGETEAQSTQPAQPEQQVAQATPPPPAPEPQAAPEQPAPVTPSSTPEELPKTASIYPLFGLIGVFSLGVFLVMRAVRMS